MNADPPTPSVQLSAQQVDAPPPPNPWPGLASYTARDASRFFGRERETAEVLRLIRRDTLTVLFGRSGTGKTSLLQAGVIPQFCGDPCFTVTVRLDYSERNFSPVEQVKARVLEVARENHHTIEKVPDDANATLWEFFHQAEFWGPSNDLLTPLLIFDQFEEAFTLGRNQTHSREFLEQLADLVENRIPRPVRDRIEQAGGRLACNASGKNYKVLLALREDFVSRLDLLRPTMPAVMRNRFPLGPLDGERALLVVLEPGGKWVSNEVAQEIVAAVARAETREEAGAGALGDKEIEPAYLNVMCHELFRRMLGLGRNAITRDLVEQERGGILEALYQRSYEGLDPKVRVFVEERLITRNGLRHSLPVAEALEEGISQSSLDELVNRRLLRFEAHLDTRHVELSHDLLAPITQRRRDERRAEKVRQTEYDLLRRRLMISFAAVVVLVLAISLYWFGWSVPRYSYCRDFSMRRGTVHPVGPLPRSAVAHRSWTLRITREGWFGHATQMDVIDSHHQLTGQHGVATYLADPASDQNDRERESRYEFVYDRTDRVIYEVAWDRFGRMTWGLVHAPATRSDRKDPMPDSSRAMFVGADGFPQPQGNSRAEFVEIHHDDLGFEVQRLYYDREGRPMAGPNKAFGERIDHDAQGRVVHRISLDERKQPMNDEFANCSLKRTYDPAGNVVRSEAFDREGQPTLTRGGYWYWKADYDGWGRETERRYYGLSGKPALERERFDAHRITSEYDEHGNLTNTKLFDTHGLPVEAGGNTFEFPAHELRITYNDRDWPRTFGYFGLRGRSLTGPDNWHRVQIEYDTNGFVAATEYVGTKRQPVAAKISGAHRTEYINDAVGRVMEECAFGTNRQPILTLDGGFHRRERHYNDQAGNHTLAESYFDTRNKPCPDRATGAHRCVQRFDRFGHPVLLEYSGPDGKPTDSAPGFCRVQLTYDDFGSELSRCWFDKANRPCNGPDGVHQVTRSYDGRGLLVETLHFDTQQRRAVDKHGVHRSVFTFNEKRQQTKWQFFALDEHPAEAETGDHLIEKEYDERGRETRITRLGLNRRPNFDPQLGIATRTFGYDRQGNVTEQSFYNAAGGLVIGPDGYARLRIRWNDQAEPAETTYFDADGSPVRGPKGMGGKLKE